MSVACSRGRAQRGVDANRTEMEARQRRGAKTIDPSALSDAAKRWEMHTAYLLRNICKISRGKPCMSSTACCEVLDVKRVLPS